MTVLFVALTIALFLGIDWLVHRTKESRAMAPAVVRGQHSTVRMPRGVFFAPSHTWLNLFPSGRAWLGVDDFVIRLLERPKVKFLKDAGSEVKRGEPLLALVDNGHHLTVRSPVDARVLSFNPALSGEAHLLDGTPFYEGWACELQPARGSELKTMLLGEETARWMQEEFRRLRDLFAGADPALSPAMLQDGGEPIAGAMKHVAPEVWKRFEQEFLDVR